MTRFRPYLLAALGVALLVSVVAFPPLRAVASRWLSVFRAETVATVRIDPRAWSEPGGGMQPPDPEALARMFAVEVRREPAEPRIVSAAEAAQLLGRPLRAPGWLPPGAGPEPLELRLVEEAEIAVTPDVGAINNYLAGQGVPVSLSPRLDGQTLHLISPQAVVRLFGDPDGPLVVADGTPPRIEGSADVNLNELAQVVGPLLGFPADLTAQLAQMDLGRTLVLPITPDSGAEVSIGGHKGVYYAEPGGHGGFIVWASGGQVHAVGGPFSRDQLLQAAGGTAG